MHFFAIIFVINMLELRDISKQYSGKAVLNRCSFTIARGQICGLFGLNGAGKSTLIKIISDVEKADSGELLFDGKKFINSKYPKVGAMIEKPAFFPNLTGYQNLKLLADLSGEVSNKDVMSALETVKLLEEKDKRVKNYSLGMQQRLYFASVIMRDVDILLLDEPFNGIDPIGCFELEELIVEYAKKGKILLVSSHNIKEIQDKVTQAIFIDKGNIVYNEQIDNSKDIFKLFLDIVGSNNTLNED